MFAVIMPGVDAFAANGPDRELIQRFKELVRIKADQGMDVSAARRLDKESMNAAREGRIEDSIRLLKEAISLLEEPSGKGMSERFPDRNISTDAYSGAPCSCSQSSFFGIHDPTVNPIHQGNKPSGSDTAEDIRRSGAGWVRLDRIFVWDDIERTKGMYRWQRADDIINEINRNNLCVSVVVMAFNKNDGTKKYIPKNMAWFLEFLQKAVERYKNAVHYWQIEGEIDNPIYWSDTPANYVNLIKQAYRVIKQANPHAKVILGGMSRPDGMAYHAQVIELLKDGRYFDIFDFHWYSDSLKGYRIHALDKVTIDSTLSRINSTLGQYGYRRVPIWIGEMGEYSGRPNHPSRSFEEHSEEFQATVLVKMYLFPMVHGVDNLFWASLTERHNFSGAKGGYFDKTGLIHNSMNDGRSDNKLSYYTYRKMAELFDGIDREKTEIIQEGDDLYIYKFMVNGKPLWAAWNDGLPRNIVIPASASAVVIPAVPIKMDDRNIEFRKETVVNTSRSIRLMLASTPVFIQSE